MQLDQVRAIVTGAASGLGRCFAKELAFNGATRDARKSKPQRVIVLNQLLAAASGFL